MLTKRFVKAIELALELHKGQVRKSTEVPFVSHLLMVSALALEAGADEDTAIACILHDAIEDGGGDTARQIIYHEFGERVARIVEECTETDMDPKPPWRERKELYLAHLASASDEARLVALCDKVHNARATLRDLQLKGMDAWKVFNAGAAEQLWWYQSLAEVFVKDQSPLAKEFGQLVRELQHYQPV